MATTKNFKFGPTETPGLIHADTVTEESSRTLEELLEQNHSFHHIFTTTEDHKGVIYHNYYFAPPQ
jgi:hypothetical protein